MYLYTMKAHNEMRPHDVIVLLKLLLMEQKPWQYRELLFYLLISVSEIAESLNRSHIAGLVDQSKRKVYRQSLMEFITYGLHYVFPQQPGPMVTGTPTAHSHPFYKAHFTAELEYVWPDESGHLRGLSIQPLYANAVKVVRLDEDLYKLLACIDIIRVGKAREVKMAISELKKKILLVTGM
jgi:hypothetical protein